MARDLLIATANPGKAAEFGRLLAGAPYRVRTLADLGNSAQVAETGDTFMANAELKASEYARLHGMLSLADDSGLEVTALGGRPGVLSARYGGDTLDFAGKMAMLLREIKETGSADRSARFVCAMAVAEPTGAILCTVEGICDGHLAERPRGTRGFGYDPLFIPAGYDLTFGELGSAIKDHISHRARAFSEIIPFLQHLVGV